MSPQDFIAAGLRAQADHEERLNKIEGRYERAQERAEAAFRARMDKIRNERDVARAAARAALDQQERQDYDALIASGHSYDEVRALRGDDL